MIFRWTLLLLLFVPVVPAFAAETTAPPDDSDGYVSLEMPVADIQQLGERCPVRVEMPLPALEPGERPRIVGVAARYVRCHGVRISHLEVHARRTAYHDVEILVRAQVIAPPGEDSSARLTFTFVSSDGHEYSTDQYLGLDEGEINWGDPSQVSVPESIDLSGLRLKVEMVVP